MVLMELAEVVVPEPTHLIILVVEVEQVLL
jgi:hypothetical protein